MRSRRRSGRSPRPRAAPGPVQPQSRLVWGIEAEVRRNRQGEIHPDQLARIKRISIFDPWVRLIFGGFFIIFGLTQSFDSWQSWVPLALGALPVISAFNGLLAQRRLTEAIVEIVEGQVDEVRLHRSDAVAATMLRDGRTMFLLAHEGTPELPRPATAYRFYAVFGVIRPPIVLAIESLE